MAVLLSPETGLRIWLEAQGGRQISTRREDVAGGNAVLPMLSTGFEIKLSDSEVENATMTGDCLWQVVEIVNLLDRVFVEYVITWLRVRASGYYIDYVYLGLRHNQSIVSTGLSQHVMSPGTTTIWTPILTAMKRYQSDHKPSYERSCRVPEALKMHPGSLHPRDCGEQFNCVNDASFQRNLTQPSRELQWLRRLWGLPRL